MSFIETVQLQIAAHGRLKRYSMPVTKLKLECIAFNLDDGEAEEFVSTEASPVIKFPTKAICYHLPANVFWCEVVVCHPLKKGKANG